MGLKSKLLICMVINMTWSRGDCCIPGKITTAQLFTGTTKLHWNWFFLGAEWSLEKVLALVGSLLKCIYTLAKSSICA